MIEMINAISSSFNRLIGSLFLVSLVSTVGLTQASFDDLMEPIYQEHFDSIDKSQEVDSYGSHYYSVIGTPDLVYVGDQASKKTWLDFLDQKLLPLSEPGMVGLFSNNDYSEAVQLFIPGGMKKDSSYTIVFYGAISRDTDYHEAIVNISFQPSRDNNIHSILTAEGVAELSFNIKDYEWRRYEKEIIMVDDVNCFTIRNATNKFAYVLLDNIEVFKGYHPILIIDESKEHLLVESDTVLLNQSRYLELFFQQDEFILSRHNMDLIDGYLEHFDAKTQYFELTGSTDLSGSIEYNDVLAKNRCAAVVRYLQSKNVVFEYDINVESGVEDNESNYHLDRKVIISSM